MSTLELGVGSDLAVVPCRRTLCVPVPDQILTDYRRLDNSRL
jgi:hypothetical protein